MPFDAPVTTATLPFSSLMMLLLPRDTRFDDWTIVCASSVPPWQGPRPEGHPATGMPKSAMVPTYTAPARTSQDFARRPWAHPRSVRRHGGCEGWTPMLRITETLRVTPDGRVTWT